MSERSIIFQSVSFTYSQLSQQLFQDLSVQFTGGWTGIVGENGVGKSTLLKLATGILKPQNGRIIAPDLSIYCEQRTDSIPDGLDKLIQSGDREAIRLMDRLQIREEWATRWDTLSHGERKRAQIALALWREPHSLALDEPVNHLDREARDLLTAALMDFNAIGLLVCHDREILDSLCSQCLFINPPNAVLRPGNYSEGLRQKQLEEDTIRKQRSNAKLEYARLKSESKKRRGEASKADRKRSKRNLARRDHDSRDKINRARITGKDAVAGKLFNQLEGRLNKAKEKVDSLKTEKKYSLGIWMPGSVSKRNTLFSLSAGSVSLGENRRLEFPDLAMLPTDRIALTGPNGCGKSTLIEFILTSLKIPGDKLTYIPQEIDSSTSQGILDRIKQLPGEKLGQLMTIVSCLGSRPDRLLETTIPSPGEIRKLLLAVGILEVPHLIIMDEPTNHLDLPSIECLEQALADCPCGLLLISHDESFLNALTRSRWSVEMESDRLNRLRQVP